MTLSLKFLLRAIRSQDFFSFGSWKLNEDQNSETLGLDIVNHTKFLT